MSKKLRKDAPLAVIDSGVGGVSVLREIVKILPNEDIIYYGDSQNAPYGTKSLEEVRKLTCQVVEMLFARGCKGLVVACNTATSAAVRVLREQYPEVPIVGIEPAVKPAVLCKENPTVLVMATPMTIHEEKLQNLIHKYEDYGEIIPLACPGFMDYIEKGDMHSEELRNYLTELLYPFKNRKIDSAVCGCTHYPFAKELLQEILGPETYIVDGGEGTAREIKRRLTVADLLNPKDEKGTILFENSLLDPKAKESKIQLCEGLLKFS